MEASTTEKRSVELTLREAILSGKVSDWESEAEHKSQAGEALSRP
jgi:hypothetical protein